MAMNAIAIADPDGEHYPELDKQIDGWVKQTNTSQRKALDYRKVAG